MMKTSGHGGVFICKRQDGNIGNQNGKMKEN